MSGGNVKLIVADYPQKQNSFKNIIYYLFATTYACYKGIYSEKSEVDKFHKKKVKIID